MRACLSAVCGLALLSLPAGAQTAAVPVAPPPSPVSAEIAATGLAATEARLSALPNPAPEDRFALGGVRFLRGVEKTLQARWTVGLNSRYSEIPVLRLPVPPNPAPEPFTADFATRLFEGLGSDMDGARAALDPIGETEDFGLTIALSDLWFDIDADGARGPGEDLAAVAGTALFGRGFATATGDGAGLPVIRFDTADTAWLTAYTHLLSGLGEVVLAYDPTEAVGKVLDTTQGLAALKGGGQMNNAFDMEFGYFVDRFAMIRNALAQAPDTGHAAAAHGHFLQVIAENRAFWRLVAAEADNEAEWVPNAAQVSGLGLTVPPETGAIWLAVLSDAEALLNGQKLMPYWRLDSGAGLNLKRMFVKPRAVDLVDWIQGAAALPYAEKGETVSPENWRRFQQLFYGDTLLFAAFLN